MDGRETPGNKVVRLGIEKKIVAYNNAGDMAHVDMGLDKYPHGKERKPLGVVAMYQALKQKGSGAARFFEKEALEITDQETGEIPVVTKEMLEDAA